MKNLFIFKISIHVLVLLCFIFASACDKEGETSITDATASGYLKVTSTNTYPVWDVQAVMDVSVSADGGILIDPENLYYRGETIVSEDSKITRSGQWQMAPTGVLQNEGGDYYIVVEPGISIINDVTRVYGKDDQGNWILLIESPYSGGIQNAPVTFSYDEAASDQLSSTQGFSDAGGSVIWTLELIPEGTPCDWMDSNPFTGGDPLQGTWEYEGDTITSTLVFRPDMTMTTTFTTDHNGSSNTDTHHYTYSYTAATLTLKEAGKPDYVTDYVLNGFFLTLSIRGASPWTYIKVN